MAALDSQTCGSAEAKVEEEEKEVQSINIDHKGRIVGSQYEIIKTVFSFLPIHHLRVCIQVCRLWADVGKIVERERHRCKPAVFFWKGKLDGYYKTGRFTGYEDPEFFDSPCHKEFNEKFDEFCAELMFEPHLVIAFGTADFFLRDETDDIPNQSPRFRTWLLDSSRLCRTFPRATVLGTSLRGIVGTESILQADGRWGYASTEIENPSRVIPGVCILCVPAWPGVQINPVFLPGIPSRTPCQKISPILQGEEYMSKIKSAVLLCDYDDWRQNLQETQKLIRSLAKHNPSISLGGGVGDLSWTSVNPMPLSEQISILESGPLHCNIALTNYLTVGFTVAGDNVCSSTVVLTRKMKSQKSVENKLLELKESMKRGNLRNSFAFMFACCGRGKSFYKGKKNLESGVFRRVFPDTPLIGIFGQGEMGFDTSSIPVHSNQELGEDLFLHGYTSIFTIISTLR